MNKILILLFSTMLVACASSKPDFEIEKASPDALKRNLELILNGNGYRNFKNVAELNRVAQLIKDTLQSYGITCHEQPYKINQDTYKNIVCNLDVESKDLVIIGAHYDVCGNQPGADDNGSGVVAMLESARILSKHQSKLKTNIEFVAYTLEEPPHFGSNRMGSYQHASAIHSSGKEDIQAFVFDMVGYYTDQKEQEYPLGILKLFYPSRGDFIASVSNIHSSGLTEDFCDAIDVYGQMDCQELNAPSWIPGVDFSDHRNYWKFGYKAMMITNTAFYRNTNYHTTHDTMDRLNFTKMAQVVDGLVLTMFLR